jgi:protease I
VILAHANVLQGKKATVWHTSLDQRPVKELEKFGAEYINQNTGVDGKIITGNGPEQAQKFGQAIIDWFGRAAETCHRESS